MNGCLNLFLHEQVTWQATWELKRTFSQKQNKGIEEDIFPKINNQKKFKKIISFFSISTACLRRHLPYIIKDDRSEELYNSLTNEGLILYQCKITPLRCCCPFSTLLGSSAGMCCLSRNSRPEVFCEKGVLRNFVKFTRKNLCQSLFFNKVAAVINESF